MRQWRSGGVRAWESARGNKTVVLGVWWGQKGWVRVCRERVGWERAGWRVREGVVDRAECER